MPFFLKGIIVMAIRKMQTRTYLKLTKANLSPGTFLRLYLGWNVSVMVNKAVMHDLLHFPGCLLSSRGAPPTLSLMVFYGHIRDRRRSDSDRSLASLLNHLLVYFLLPWVRRRAPRV